MNPKKKLLLWLAMSLTAMTANSAADVPVPADFAEGMHVTPAGDSAVQYFEIPYEVYKGVTRKDHGDIAVFDAGGNPVPWAIRHAQSMRTETIHNLPLFPLYGADNKSLEDLSLKIERNADGTLVDIQAAGVSSQANASAVEKIAYLFDLQPIGESVDGRLGELVFDWHNSTTDTIWSVMIEGSDDLQNWETLVFDAVLTGLDYGGQTLVKNTVPILPFADIKYLRMSWPEGRTAPDLTKVTAKFQSHKTNAEWRSRLFKLTPVETAAGYMFSTGGFVPVEKFSFELPDGNSLYKGKLYSRIDDEHDWTLRGEFLQYRLRVQDTVLVSDEQAIPPATDPQWLLTYDEPRMGNFNPPDIRIGWKAEYLHFLALGQAPYTLAYGNGSAGQAGYPSDTLKQLSAQQDTQADTAKLSASFVLGGEQKRLPPEKPLPWRTILLWMVLLAGVALMAGMALSLYRQMNSA